jgi:beta-glucosidase
MVTPAYRDATRGTAERVADLLARMTLAEKAAQLGSAWVFQLAGPDGLRADRAEALLAGGLGQVTRLCGASSLPPRRAAEVANEIQRHLVERTRLGVPAIVHEEVCSGLMARDATVFPQAIGVASSWRPELAGELAGAVRRQMRAIGAHQGLSPVLDVCRDPRWGRTEETFGEDPHLVAAMGAAFVRGLQGDDLRDGVLATAKHFVGYGASEGGLNWAPAHLPARELRDVYLRPFEAAVRAGLRSVMNGYHELDGVPCAADSDLLTGVLRDGWGFDGTVVSDYFSVRQLAEYHRLAADAADAATTALTAGLDVELPSTDCFGAPLLAALSSGALSMEVLDRAARRVLRAKFELGLFERPYVDVDAVAGATGPARYAGLARRIADQSLILLSNNGVLPLKGTGMIAVIGPNAAEARHLFGDYTYPAHVESLREMAQAGRNTFSMPIDGAAVGTADGVLDRVPTVLDALRDRFGDRIRFAAGCAVDTDDRAGIPAAVELAAGAEVAVLVVGDRSGLTDACTSGESRDRASLDLPGVQEDLVRAVLATGTPVVLVLVSGRPCGSADIHRDAAAVLAAWLPGQEGAAAIAGALAGATNPGGKLPIGFPRSVGQLPVYYGHKTSGGRSHWKGDYVDAPVAPLYPFGHGLSYTTFALTGAALDADEVAPDGSVCVTVLARNTGAVAGDEVVQLYGRRPRASVTRPVLELTGFARVTLDPGQGRRVSFEVPAAQLGFHGRDLRYTVEPGAVELLVGTSTGNLAPAGTVTVLPGDQPPPGRRFEGRVTIG